MERYFTLIALVVAYILVGHWFGVEAEVAGIGGTLIALSIK